MASKKKKTDTAKYSVKFIDMSNGAVGATKLEKMLNNFAEDDWSIIRSDIVNTGVLIIAVKQPEAPKTEPIGLQDFLARIGVLGMTHVDSDQNKLKPETKKFLDEFFRINNSSDTSKTISRTGEVLAGMLPKIPNEKLRPLIDELKDHANKHAEKHNGEPCDLVKIITKIVELSELHLQRNVS